MGDLDFKIIGLKIKERRKALNITQEYVAEQLDVNPSHISNIECGRANPSLTTLIKIANVLQCSVDCFVDAEYTYPLQENTLENQIIKKIQNFDEEKKYKILKIIDII